MITVSRLLPSGAVESRRFRTQAKNWEAFGRRDPLFGVLSDPAKAHGRWDVDEFFESGRAHVAKLFRILAEHDVTFVAGRALDFGCGVGRLTRPISDRFEQTVGVDVAPSMIRLARRYSATLSRCEFVLNTHPDLRGFETGSFDFVHSCLVLQHIPPDVSLRYIAEFLRIARPGGVIAFQVPAGTFTEQEIDARHALPPDGYRAGIELSAAASLVAGATSRVPVRVTNLSGVTWLTDIPGGRHICVANHWLDANGVTIVPDDGRARLPCDVRRGESVDVVLEVTAPGAPGSYLLEVDLVQERICWFAQRGSRTGRARVDVGAAGGEPTESPRETPRAQVSSDEGIIARVRRALQGAPPVFEMHVLPRADVETAVVSAGGAVEHVIEDAAAGAGWLSYTYVCRKLR